MWLPSSAEPPTNPTIHPTSSSPACPWVVNVLAFDDTNRDNQHTMVTRSGDQKTRSPTTENSRGTKHPPHTSSSCAHFSLLQYTCTNTIQSPDLDVLLGRRLTLSSNQLQSMTTRVLVRSPPTTRCHDIPSVHPHGPAPPEKERLYSVRTAHVLLRPVYAPCFSKPL